MKAQQSWRLSGECISIGKLSSGRPRCLFLAVKFLRYSLPINNRELAPRDPRSLTTFNCLSQAILNGIEISTSPNGYPNRNSPEAKDEALILFSFVD